jgi:hypothetical protein
MIITFSAAQGQGKTTLIDDILEKSIYKNDLEKYPYKSARLILDKLDMSLEDIYESKDALVQFQQEILKTHCEIFSYEYSKKYLLVERSFIDIMLFSVINLGRFNSLNKWLDAFCDICVTYQQRVHYSILIRKKITPSNDYIRPINHQYNHLFDIALKDYFLKQNNVFIISTVDRNERVIDFNNMITYIKGK